MEAAKNIRGLFHLGWCSKKGIIYMPNTISYPSSQFPAPPRVTIVCPDGWNPLLIPEAVLALAKEPIEGDFRPNVVVAVSRHPSGFALNDAATAVSDKLSTLDSLQLVVSETVTLSGFPSHRVEVTFSDARVGTLAQAIVIVLVDTGRFVDLVQITGSCSAKQIAFDFAPIREILSTASISTAR
jgi:hypothetical protein